MSWRREEYFPSQGIRTTTDTRVTKDILEFPLLDLEKPESHYQSIYKISIFLRPLAWMCHIRTVNNKINKLYERVLRLVYDDRQSTFKELVNKLSSPLKFAGTCYRNVQSTSQIIAWHYERYFFLKKCLKCNFRNYFSFATKNVKSTHYGSETIFYLGPKIWALSSKSIWDSQNIHIFKSNVKLWKSENCPCRLCKIYLANGGFV